MTSIAVVDCGTSNLRSIENAIRFLGHDPVIVTKPTDEAFTHWILPGVGSFHVAMANLSSSGLHEFLVKKVMEPGVRLLGICLGMQILAESGDEFGPTKGLGLVSGTVRLLKTDLRVPHVGWNDVSMIGQTPLWDGIPPQSDFYFIHSYAMDGVSPEHIVGTVDYGGERIVAVCNGNVMGVQFHPEKSQKVGLQLLRNFVELC